MVVNGQNFVQLGNDQLEPVWASGTLTLGAVTCVNGGVAACAHLVMSSDGVAQ